MYIVQGVGMKWHTVWIHWGRKKTKKKENIVFVLNLGSGRPSDMIQNMGVQKNIYCGQNTWH